MKTPLIHLVCPAFLLLLVSVFCFGTSEARSKKRKSGLTELDRRLLSQRVTYGFSASTPEEMFRHGFSGYMEHAWPHDELLPLTCAPGDRYGQYMTTLVDALPAAFLFMDNAELTALVSTKLVTLDFNRDVNVSVFETNIRILGGLVSTYLLAEERDYLTPELRSFVLSKAVDLADRLLPAFNTSTGMPYGTVNLMHGVSPSETPITCTAGVGTFIMEFGALSRITNDPKYEVAARRALRALWRRRSSLDLFGNHIDTRTGHWTAHGSSVGTYTDSFYEYLVKAAFLFNDPELQCMAVSAMTAAETYLKQDGWLTPVNMNTGMGLERRTDSMAAFWPGLLVLDGDVGSAFQLADRICGVWDRYGFTSEFWKVPSMEVEELYSAYPLRPELIESLFYLSWAKRPLFENDKIQNFGYKMLNSIQTHCKVPCGYAGIANIKTKEKLDQMDSFFFAETVEYLHLLLNEDHWVRKGKYVFTTEGHMFPYQWRFSKRPEWADSILDSPCRNPSPGLSVCPRLY